MKDDPSISGKKTVEESVVESSWMWVDGVFQDGLKSHILVQKKLYLLTDLLIWRNRPKNLPASPQRHQAYQIL